MKLIISNYDDRHNPFYGGGGANAIHEVAKRLTNTFDVTVITGNYSGARPEVIDNVIYERLGSPKSGPKLGQLQYQLTLPFEVRRRTFDIWIESFTPPFSTACLQLFTSKPVIGLVHMLSGEDMHRKYHLPFQLLERWGLKTYRYFIVLTDTMKQHIKRYNPNSFISAIPNGIERPRFTVPYESRQRDYILFIGRIEVNQKGLDILLDAYQQLYQKIPVRLKIAGTGTLSELTHLKRYITRLGLGAHVDLVGKVSGKAKEALITHALCVVVPSRFETFSMASLEALAQGTPLVTFNLPSLSWIPDTCARKAVPFSSENLAQEIESLYHNASIGDQLHHQARAVSQSFQWHHIVDQYTHVLMSLAKNESTVYG